MVVAVAGEDAVTWTGSLWMRYSPMVFGGDDDDEDDKANGRLSTLFSV